MHALILAAALAGAPQTPGQTTRDIVIGVCLPFAAAGETSADNIALAGLQPRPGGDGDRDLQTANGHHLVKLTVAGDVEAGTLRRVCEVQARAGGFEQARDAVAGPLERAGFAPVPDEPEDWPVWTRGGVTATVHQNPGRATILRVSYSILDDEAS
ncbi:hypothetical protein N0B44_18840 [Roseibacterium beibuensis]|uniref:hypothetical protein n=1 Tax=[Roseibacterium] beibuensis TaxID=1193142 RepID=UPI00217E0490|nr:hypothetical protein [Roseibacterium beibuensis]MCS6624975.1 hypothetical protein [Roseibacterium beibuensis]